MTARERLEAYRDALLAELGSVSHAKTGDPQRVVEVNAQIAKVDAELAALDDDTPPAAVVEEVAVPEAPETTEAPDAPEKAVKPSPKRRTKPE